MLVNTLLYWHFYWQNFIELDYERKNNELKNLREQNDKRRALISKLVYRTFG